MKSFIVLLGLVWGAAAFAQTFEHPYIDHATFARLSREDQRSAVKLVMETMVSMEEERLRLDGNPEEKTTQSQTLRKSLEFLNSFLGIEGVNADGNKNYCLYSAMISTYAQNKGAARPTCTTPDKASDPTVRAKYDATFAKGQGCTSKATQVVCNPVIFGTMNDKPFCATNVAPQNASLECFKKVVEDSKGQPRRDAEINAHLDKIINGILSNTGSAAEFNELLKTIYNICLCGDNSNVSYSYQGKEIDKRYRDYMSKHRTCLALLGQSQRLLTRVKETNPACFTQKAQIDVDGLLTNLSFLTNFYEDQNSLWKSKKLTQANYSKRQNELDNLYSYADKKVFQQKDCNQNLFLIQDDQTPPVVNDKKNPIVAPVPAPAPDNSKDKTCTIDATYDAEKKEITAQITLNGGLTMDLFKDQPYIEITELKTENEKSEAKDLPEVTAPDVESAVPPKAAAAVEAPQAKAKDAPVSDPLKKVFKDIAPKDKDTVYKLTGKLTYKETSKGDLICTSKQDLTIAGTKKSDEPARKYDVEAKPNTEKKEVVLTALIDGKNDLLGHQVEWFSDSPTDKDLVKPKEKKKPEADTNKGASVNPEEAKAKEEERKAAEAAEKAKPKLPDMGEGQFALPTKGAGKIAVAIKEDTYNVCARFSKDGVVAKGGEKICKPIPGNRPFVPVAAPNLITPVYDNPGQLYLPGVQ